MNNNASYLTQRLIDTCLREDLFGLVSQSQFTTQLPESINNSIQTVDQIWAIFDSSDFTLYLPITASYYMQSWVYSSPAGEDGKGWIIDKNGQIEHQCHYQDWIGLLKACAHESSHSLLDNYLQGKRL